MTILLAGLMICPVYAEETGTKTSIPLSTDEDESSDTQALNDVSEFAYTYIDINNVNDLAAALGAGSVTILSATDIVLTQNIICSSQKALRFVSGVCNIDFNGFAISENIAMDIKGGEVTFKDSSVAQTGGIDNRSGSMGRIFTVDGGNLTILSGIYQTRDAAVAVLSGAFTIKGGTIHLFNEIYYAVYISGGTLNMSGGMIEAGWGIDLTNGSATISGGKVVSEWFAIYVFDTTASISGGDFYGKMSGLFIENLSSQTKVALTGGNFSSDPYSPCGGVVSTKKTMDKPQSIATYLCPGYVFDPSTITEAVWAGNNMLLSHTTPTVSVISSKNVEGFVGRLYTKALGRTPDPIGFADWVSQLKAKKISGGQAAYGFFFSPELTNRNVSDSDFIQLLYNVFFDRAPDSAGFSYWMSTLETGVSRKYVFAGFANSQEWKTLCGIYAIEPGSYASDEARDQNIKVTGFVQRLYTLCLNRWADVPGLNYWTDALNSKKQDGAHAAYGFFFSSEFQNRKLSDENYVDVLYRVLLGRTSDSTGKADWVAQLKAGKDRLEVFRGFVHSQEFEAICADYGITRGTI